MNEKNRKVFINSAVAEKVKRNSTKKTMGTPFDITENVKTENKIIIREPNSVKSERKNTTRATHRKNVEQTETKNTATNKRSKTQKKKKVKILFLGGVG